MSHRVPRYFTRKLNYKQIQGALSHIRVLAVLYRGKKATIVKYLDKKKI